MFGFLPGPCQCFPGADRSVYRQHFCGLGTALHDHYGAWSRFLVNRDATFLSLVATGLQQQPAQPVFRTCCNPFASARLMVDQSPGALFAASVSICGLAAKLEDSAEDNRGWKRWLAQRSRGWIDGATLTAQAWLRRWDFPTTQVTQALQGQSSLERRGVSFSEATEPTAEAFGHILGHLPWVAQESSTLAPGMDAASAAHALKKAGQHLGRLIYTLDAVEDWHRDTTRGHFNPLPTDADTRHALVQEVVATEFSGLAQSHQQLSFAQHGELISSLWGNAAVARTEQRLRAAIGLANQSTSPDHVPPPLPPGYSQPNKPQTPAERRKAERQQRREQRAERCQNGRCGRCADCCSICDGRCCDCCIDTGPKDFGCCDCCDCNPCN